MVRRVWLARDGLSKRRYRQFAWSLMFGLAVVVCSSLVTVQFVQPRPRLIWNTSASAPVGLYWLADKRDLKRGVLVLVWLPGAARKLAAERRYLPSTIPAIKRVAGLAGDTVCVKNSAVMINDRMLGTTLPADRLGRPLAVWWGCRALEADEIFLLNDGSAASFDGRYFGPSQRRDVIGKLVPLWTF
jgi:conjugative transfer signal peptidase TraF